MTCRVLLADDHAVFRSGLRALLRTQADLECVGEAADGGEAVAEAMRLVPDLVVLDVRMPRMDGIEAAEAIHSTLGTRTRVLVLTTYDLDEYVHRALRAGASGFMLKNSSPEDLLSAMRIVARGDALIDPSVTRRLVSQFAASFEPVAKPGSSPAGLERLTDRERDVLLLVADARSNAEIADLLHIGEETVKTHVSRILSKLELRDRLHVVIYAFRNGLIS